MWFTTTDLEQAIWTNKKYNRSDNDFTLYTTALSCNEVYEDLSDNTDLAYLRMK